MATTELYGAGLFGGGGPGRAAVTKVFSPATRLMCQYPGVLRAFLADGKLFEGSIRSAGDTGLDVAEILIGTEGFFYVGTTGGGGTVDTVSRAADTANATAIRSVRAVTGETVPPAETRFVAGNLWRNPTAAAVTIPATTTDAALTGAGLVKSASAQVDEVVLSASTDLTGTPPAGARFGVNIATGRQFVVSGGVWTAEVVAVGQRALQTVRTNATQSVAPTAIEHPTPASTDTHHIFLNDSSEEYWTFGTAWTRTAFVPAPSADTIIVATIAALPDPATVRVGRLAVVTNDGLNSGGYSATGAAVGSNALSWLKDG